MEVALCPEAYLYAMLASILTKETKVLYVALERACLSVTSALSIIRKDPSERHVVSRIAVNHGTSRELVATVGRHTYLTIA